MRLTKILLPEIIKGTRGPEDAIRFYEKMTGMIDEVGPHGLRVNDTRLAQSFDQVMQSNFALAWKYKNQGARTYHIGRDFANAMVNVKKEIPLDLLPERFFAYFSFPENTFTDVEEGAVAGGFIFIGDRSETIIRENANLDYGPMKKVVWINYIIPAKHPAKENAPFTLDMKCAGLVMPLDEGIQKALEAPQLPNVGEAPTEVCRAFINLAIYINSLNPDVLPTKPIQDQSNSKRKEFYTKHGVANHCTVPVTFVSWNYKKPVTYSVDSTMVSSHFRWQRCGPGFSQVKLILIDEHERHFKEKEL